MISRRSLVLFLALGVAAGALGATTSEIGVTVADLQAADVIYDPGATPDADDQARLQGAADDLRAKGFPTKFIVTGTRLADADATARGLRDALGAELGDIQKIKAVFVLGPRQLGTGANAFPAEIAEAFEAERTVFENDAVAGVINVANRLQERDAAGLLPGEELPDDDFNWLLFILLPALVLLAGIVAVVMIRRSVARGQAARSGGSDAPDDDARSEGETPDP
jgi:hypothetical protein